MCIYSPMPHTLSYCALIGKCALIRSNTVYLSTVIQACLHAQCAHVQCVVRNDLDFLNFNSLNCVCPYKTTRANASLRIHTYMTESSPKNGNCIFLSL